MEAMFSLDETRDLISDGNYDVVPVACELIADELTPIVVLRRLQHVSSHCYILESAEASVQGRFTFLGYDPTIEITCKDGRLCIRNGKESLLQTLHPAEYIRELLLKYRSPSIHSLPPFTGGLVGYFSYDYIKYTEPSLSLDAADEECFNDLDLMLFDKVIVFDNFCNKLILIVNVGTDDLTREYHRALHELETMRTLILDGDIRKDIPGRITSEWRELFNHDSYEKMVIAGKNAIHEGDIFQVVLSNRLDAGFEGTLLNTYRILRTTNPSPYMFYFTSDDIELAGASPETLIRLDGNFLYTYPLAGTRARGKTPEEDARIELELLGDEKELAEHNMLVDLGRNDLGKVSEYGSVVVEKYLGIERFSHVMHIGSTVVGQLRQSFDALDALGAVLPAGTLSGAPKIRACEIINELENCKRGVYGGAIGYISFTGNMDMCIAIRLVFKKNGKVFIRSGAGIVADSVPETEYLETINKAAAVRHAIENAQGGVVR